MIRLHPVRLLISIVLFAPWIAITANPITHLTVTPTDSHVETTGIVHQLQINSEDSVVIADSVDDDSALDAFYRVDDAIIVKPLGFGDWVRHVIERLQGAIPPDFFERARNLQDQFTRYSSDQFNNAIEFLKKETSSSMKVVESVQHVKQITNDLVDICSKLRSLMAQSKGLRDYEVDVNSISVDLGNRFQHIIDDMKDSFPPPNQALSHNDRQQIVDQVLDKVRVVIIEGFCRSGLHLDEEEVTKIWTEIRSGLSMILVTTGDLVEQHPKIFHSLIFGVIGLILPEEWILARLLGLFGWGPYGPVQGSVAAYLQSRIFRATIPKHAWFAVLQRLAQLRPIQKPGFWKGIFGGIGAALGSIFGFVNFGMNGSR
ncbi:hypothetical protein C8Q75DRAFT_888286 [Abortiporus biennis]|nr:hypothetical protein C8Q75DRAFT_888286 [Abortiporus biennis]